VIGRASPTAWLTEAEPVESPEPLSCDRCRGASRKLFAVTFQVSGLTLLHCAACHFELRLAYGLEVNG